jgi:tetratricopeptide (TPR) repeat protein
MDKIRSRHASYFLALTQKVHDKRTDADAGQWLAVLDGEYANCVAALKGLRERNEIRQLVSFETLIAQYRYIRGLIGEGRDGLERALALGADEGLSSVAAYCSCSEFARLQGDHDAAKQHAETALGLARGDGSPDDDEGLALKQLGIIEMFDDLERSVLLLEESVAIRRARGSSREVANSLNNLAEANRLRGNHDAAISYLLEALAMCDRMNDIEGLAMTSMTASTPREAALRRKRRSSESSSRQPNSSPPLCAPASWASSSATGERLFTASGRRCGRARSARPRIPGQPRCSASPSRLTHDQSRSRRPTGNGLTSDPTARMRGRTALTAPRG